MNSRDTKETILVVDDTPSTLEVLQRNLTVEGYTTYTAPNAVDALNLLDGTFVDLVITDLKMPKISGIDLIRHIRENYQRHRRDDDHRLRDRGERGGGREERG